MGKIALVAEVVEAAAEEKVVAVVEEQRLTIGQTLGPAQGDIARLHEAVLAYARDFMINKGFTYVIPPFMMHGDALPPPAVGPHPAAPGAGLSGYPAGIDKVMLQFA